MSHLSPLLRKDVMKRYLLRKLMWLMPQIIIVSFICFILVKLMPTDPAEASLRVNNVPVITETLLEQRRAELGLNQPFLTQYTQWLLNALTLNFGTSYVFNRPVNTLLFQAIPATLSLAVIALIMIVTISFTLGIATAIYKGTWFDKVSRFFLFFVTSAPSFWIGLTLVWIFGVILKWLPTSGMTHPLSVVLPALTLALMYLSTYVRLIRGKMIEQYTENYVLYARVRGLSQKMILKYVVKNSLQATIASMSMSIPKLLAGTVVIENIFAWPGLGRVVVDAIFSKDYPVIQAYILIMAVIFIVLGTLMDVLMYVIDPRLRGDLS